jgi:hypothetical protein
VLVLNTFCGVQILETYTDIMHSKAGQQVKTEITRSKFFPFTFVQFWLIVNKEFTWYIWKLYPLTFDGRLEISWFLLGLRGPGSGSYIYRVQKFTYFASFLRIDKYCDQIVHIVHFLIPTLTIRPSFSTLVKKDAKFYLKLRTIKKFGYSKKSA